MVWKPVNNERNAKIKNDREFNEMKRNIENNITRTWKE